ncbi:MAG: DUF4422 domain-containing protein [Lachnospiraceae bacterium]|nr:DUF4422 domain-containing protein [Lachnospiraceae bacterium]
MIDLKNYIISSHMDKPLLRKPEESKYDVMIQAGAALTDIRKYELNDHDGFPDSISDRNSRYSETTAMYYIYKHISSDYVGILHYRRRFGISDDQIEGILKDGFEVITSVPAVLESSVREQFCINHYAADWDLFLSLLNDEDRIMADECFSERLLHGGNINILRSDIYIDLCDWMFPILEQFYERSPSKTDVYQHRDVGFIAERLSHMYVMKLKKSGRKVYEAPLIQLASAEQEPMDKVDLSDPVQVYNECDRLYREHKITKCGNLLGAAMKTDSKKDQKLIVLLEILTLGILERRECSRTMHEYLPEELRSNLDVLIETYKGYKQILRLSKAEQFNESEDLLKRYSELTGFSETLTRELKKMV